VTELALVSIDTRMGRCVRYLRGGGGHFATVPYLSFPPEVSIEPEIIEDFRTNARNLPAQPSPRGAA
jgi:hypothetical protein